MDNTFYADEKLYRAVYPPEAVAMFWRKDGSLSSAAFADPKGLSVPRYCPSRQNPWHSEIRGSETSVLLSKSQRLYLAEKAVVMGREDS